MNAPRPARLTAADFHPEVLRLFDQYVHGGIDRRAFLDRSSRFAAASGTTAAGLLAALSPDFAYGAEGGAHRPARAHRKGRDRVARGPRQDQRATWCVRRRPPVRCRWCWWCTRTGA
jgi:hypothetical protein